MDVPESQTKQNKKVSRGPRKSKLSTFGSLQIYYNNINGFNCKASSLKKILNESSPDVVALCETKRGCGVRKKQDLLPGYEVIERNNKRGHEGLMLAVN